MPASGPTAVKAARPTPKQSEIDVGNTLPKDARGQMSYKDGKEVKYGEKGSVRPDWCIGATCSIEVKNYDIHKNRNGLVNNIAKQAKQRKEHLPKNMKQEVRIDLRGQNYSAKDLVNIKSSIEKKTNGIINSKNITFITGD